MGLAKGIKIFTLSSLLLIGTPLMAAVSSEAQQSSILSGVSAAPKETQEPQQEQAPAATNVIDKHPMDTSDDMQMPSYEGAFVKMLLTLVGLILMVCITVWLLKKMAQGRIGAFGKKQVNILERRPLSQKTVLYVVEVSGKQILVAESQLEVKTLMTIDEGSEISS